MRLIRRNGPLFISISLSLVFCCAFSFISLSRFWQYDAGYYDFGIFDRALWLASRFQKPIIDHFIVGGKVIFADHFNPSIFILSPLYWITSRQEIMLIAQSCFVAVSSVIIYLTAYRLLKSHISALFVQIIYVLSTPLHHGIFYDFHEVTISVFFICLSYWFVATKRYKLLILSVLVTLGFKESLSLWGIGLALWLLMHEKKRIIGLRILGISLIWFVLAIFVVIPYANGGASIYVSNMNPSSSFILDRMGGLFGNVLLLIASSGFISVFGVDFYPLIALHFIPRMVNTLSQTMSLGLHYNAELVPTYTFMLIISIERMSRRFSIRPIYIVIFALSISLISFYLYRGPLWLARNMAYFNNTKNFEYITEGLRTIPQTSTVAAQNNLAGYLTHNKDVHILRDAYTLHDPDYVVFEIRDGQRANNQSGISNILKLNRTIEKDPAYELAMKNQGLYIYKKKSIE
ncbi:MAG: DUF2079 domain-containing protein [Candidatus Roizmanbacteria bacterium]